MTKSGPTFLVTFQGAHAAENVSQLTATSSLTSNPLSAVTFVGNAPTCAAGKFACVDLPIYVGTTSSQVPIDFLDGNPGAGGVGLDHHLRGSIGINLPELIDGSADGDSGFAFAFTLPNWGQFNFELPSIFALLSDPAALVDGLNAALETLQDGLSGQVFGVKLPLLGDLLADNPAAKLIGNLRGDVLTPLADTIRENDLDLDGLVLRLRKVLGAVFGDGDATIGIPTGLGILDDRNGDSLRDFNDIQFRFLDAERKHEVNVFVAKAAQFDFAFRKVVTFSPAEPITLDVGIDALGVEGEVPATGDDRFPDAVRLRRPRRQGLLLRRRQLHRQERRQPARRRDRDPIVGRGDAVARLVSGRRQWIAPTSTGSC